MPNGRAPEPRPSTSSLATLTVSAAAYDEIATKLRNADYFHVFRPDGVIDLSGLGLVRLSPEMTKRREG